MYNDILYLMIYYTFIIIEDTKIWSCIIVKLNIYHFIWIFTELDNMFVQIENNFRILNCSMKINLIYLLCIGKSSTEVKF